jgi:hypothetical protein
VNIGFTCSTSSYPCSQRWQEQDDIIVNDNRLCDDIGNTGLTSSVSGCNDEATILSQMLLVSQISRLIEQADTSGIKLLPGK